MNFSINILINEYVINSAVKIQSLLKFTKLFITKAKNCN